MKFSVQVQSESLALAHSKQWKSTCKSSLEVAGASPLGIVEANMQEKSKQSGVNMQEKPGSIEVGEVVNVLGKAAQMKLMASKLLKEEVGEVVTKANPEAGEEIDKSDVSFPHEPGADSEQSKIKEMKEIDPWTHWTRWRRCGAAERFPRLSKKAEVAEAQTSGKEEKTKSSHPEMKVEKVLYTAEQCRLLAEVEAWGEEDAEPGLHVELLPASKELMAEVEAWGHEDDAEADISEPSCAPEREAEEAEIVMKALAEEDCLSRKLASSACCDEEELVQEKKEQYREVPLMIEKQNSVGVSLSMQGAELKQGSHPYLMQVEGVSGTKAEAETMIDRMQLKKVKQRLKEEKMSRYAIDWHELIADKLVPPGREWSGAEAQASVSSVKVEVISAKDRLDEVEKVWQGSVPLVIDKQDQVEVSLSKVEMRLMMHALKAEAVQFKNTEVKLVEDKLMKGTLMKLLNVKDGAEQLFEEGHEAPPLLVDKQAAAAG